MSEQNLAHLRAWKPRRPSPELRARIFGKEPERTIPLADLSRWLVPAFGCFLLVMATLSNHLPIRYGVQLAATNMVLPALTEEGARGVMPSPPGHSGVNALPDTRLEWNFAARPSTSSAGAVLIAYTNKLIR